MNLADLPRVFAEEAKRCGLPAGWRLKIDKATNRFGLCCYSGRFISISRALALANSEERVRKTVVHEIAHALVGPGYGHGEVWRAKDRELGGDGARCWSERDTKVADLPWIAECPGCNKLRQAARKPTKLRSCGACSGGFYNAAFKLEWKPRDPTKATPKVIISNEPSDVIKRVLELRARGLGYVDIDANFGIYGKRGWWSWKIVKAAKAAKETNE